MVTAVGVPTPPDWRMVQSRFPVEEAVARPWTPPGLLGATHHGVPGSHCLPCESAPNSPKTSVEWMTVWPIRTEVVH